jgi:hypothetical protein
LVSRTAASNKQQNKNLHNKNLQQQKFRCVTTRVTRARTTPVARVAAADSTSRWHCLVLATSAQSVPAPAGFLVLKTLTDSEATVLRLPSR